MSSERIPLPEFCQRTGQSDATVRRQMMKGEVQGGQDERGRWFVDASEFERFASQKLGRQVDDEFWISRALVASMRDEDRFVIGRQVGIDLKDSVLDRTRDQLAKIPKGPDLNDRQGPTFSGTVLPFDGSFAQRANIDSATSTTGGPFKFSQPGAFVDLLRAKMALSQAGATVIPGLTGPVTFPKGTGAATATWRAENPGSDLGYTNLTTNNTVTLAFKTVQAATAVSRQALFSAASGNYDMERVIRHDLATVIALAIDLAGVNGLGASNQPLGVLQDTAVATASIGANGGTLTGTFCAQMVSDVFSNNADPMAPSSRWLTNGSVERSTRNLQRATNINLPLLTDDNRLAGKPAVFSNQVPNNLTKGTSTTVCSAAIFGQWEYLTIGMFGAGIDAVVDPFGLKLQNLIGISLSAYCDIANRQQSAFKKVVDITTP